MQQALTKIFENAVESFGPKDAARFPWQTRNVELTEATQDRNVRLAAGTYVCVEISDNGAGIEADVLPRIFEPFFTTKSRAAPRPRAGAGLWHRHQPRRRRGDFQPGRAKAPRRGFICRRKRRSSRDSPAADEELHGTGTILVVDDESLVLTMAETILSDFGYKVLTANNGQKALAAFGAAGHACGSGDHRPGDAGHGRTRIDRAHPAARAWRAGPVHERLCAAGGQADRHAGYLQKPFTSAELAAPK